MQPLSLKVDSKRLPVTTQGEYLQYAESVCNTNANPWMCDKEVLHACSQLAVIMKDVEGSLDDV